LLPDFVMHCIIKTYVWAKRDLNPRHPACKAGALPAELFARALFLCDAGECIKWPWHFVNDPERVFYVILRLFFALLDGGSVQPATRIQAG
jgi:hypothetical protein